ncbi:hypothetical protein FLO80_19545 [Aquicoccus porphyridii]|uniref:PH domain-containing protein n=1 Tax=Aquicoccus porphyridii TaxID=1852029 RepID=A0A5A9YXW4_9RHOB|nr:hypothetical protein [Aquicoccus porphyridii]KAA0909853.1 hypothetical protein FLO80_19545 [Aquicoccus porphyridii]RAI53234.1 hypothetical protein DOO74_12960 [Rhodobacteraceae bacterium AsT-22]
MSDRPPDPPPLPPGFTHESHGRSRAALITLALTYATLIALVMLIDMAWWIALGFALFTLPALWEFITNPRATLTLDDRGLGWQTRTTGDSLPLALIDKVRFDTRLDLSVRITLILRDGRKIRLPHAATPPHRPFEDLLKAHGIRTERHHFSLIG